jgi:hypothetical protein
MNYEEHDRIPMQYLIIEAAPDLTFDQKDRNIVGSAVGCWIKNQTKTNALHVARGWIEAQGWVVLDLIDQYPVSSETYKNKTEGREYFEQALTDDEVFVFHTYKNIEPGGSANSPSARG